MVMVTLPAEAAMWRPVQAASSPLTLPLGVLGVIDHGLGLAASDAAPGQSQSQSPQEGGSTQTQSRQSQSLRAPDDDDDDDDDDDAFFADPGVVYVEEAPAAPAEQIIEIEVPEGSTVEYEIIEENGVQVVRPRIVTPAPAPVVTPAPAPVVTPAPIVAPAPQARPIRAAPPRATTEVHFHSRATVEVQRRDPSTREWVSVCWTPCVATVPVDAVLRVHRNGDIPRSKPFTLDGDGPRHGVEIRPGSRRQQGAGFGIALLSMVGMVTGAVMVDATARYADRDRRSYEGYLVLGMATITYVAGIAMAIANRTAVREGPTGRRLALAPGGLRF